MNITVREASLILEGSEEWVRSLLRRGICGDAWTTGKYRHTYVILPTKLANYMEISTDELEKRLNQVRKR